MMVLIGMFDSPFVRRVAVSMNFLGLLFEHRNWSVGKDFDRIREFNPLGRVPTLVLESGEALQRHAAAAGTGAWLLGGGPTQADITVVCVYSFMRSVLPAIVEPGRHPALAALAARAESLPEFQASAMPAYTTPGEHVAVGAGVSRPGNSEGP